MILDALPAPVLPILFTVFVWWFGTGVVYLLNQLPKETFGWSMLGASAVLGIGFLGLLLTAGDTGPGGPYHGFLCAVLIWAWAEIGLLTGLITGPSRKPCPPGAEGMERFRAALATIIHHEIAILVLAALLVALLWGAPNQVALHTFLVLWVMRQSAKLNIYLGARNLGESMLPPHLRHLASYFRQRPMNALFPVSITGGTVAVILLVQQGMGGGEFAVTAGTLLGALMALAVIEHWFLMLPLPLDGLWTWGRPVASPANPAACPQRVEPARLPLRP